MITVVSAEWGGYQGRAIEYIDKLKAGVARHLDARHWFVCLRLDDSPLPGWFRKLEIFRPGRFSGRVLYLDLDSVIVGPLDPLVYRKGAVHLKDWGWSRNVHFGGVWVFDAEVEGRRIWDAYNDTVPDKFVNDQEWLTSLGIWPALPRGLVASFRYHCASRKAEGGRRKAEGGRRKAEGPPPGCAVVAFHGQPKPHQVNDAWVKDAWRA